MAFNLSKADPSASPSSKGKFNLSKTEVAGGENNPNSNEPKKGKSKLGLILLILAIGVGAWFFLSKNSDEIDLVENPDTGVSADSKNADLAKSDEASTAPATSASATPNNSAKATETKTSTAPATSASAKPNNSAKATEAKASTAPATSASAKPSNSAKATEAKASTAPATSASAKPSKSAKATEAKASTATASSTKNTTTASNPANAAKSNSNSTTSGAVNFKNGSAELMDLNDSKISTILDKLKSNPNLEINVEGYASSEGDLEFNKNLSQKRADKYSSYLVSQGVPKNNIKSIGKGIDNPIASNETEEGRAQNRRVEVIIK